MPYPDINVYKVMRHRQIHAPTQDVSHGIYLIPTHAHVRKTLETRRVTPGHANAVQYDAARLMMYADYCSELVSI